MGISQGSVATWSECGGICKHDYCTFTAESNSERIFKIGKHLAKLRTRLRYLVFWLTVYLATWWILRSTLCQQRYDTRSCFNVRSKADMSLPNRMLAIFYSIAGLFRATTLYTLTKFIAVAITSLYQCTHFRKGWSRAQGVYSAVLSWCRGHLLTVR